MKIIADLHVHTVASGHAMGTLNEMIGQAKQLGYQAMAVTDHACAMPGTAHRYYFTNLWNQPNWLDDGFLLLHGIEANVMDAEGRLDMPDEDLKHFNWVIASCHTVLVPPMSFDETTNMWLKLAENTHVDMIGHSEQKEFRYDYDRVAKAFAANNKVVEFNAASAFTRPGNEENLRNLAITCKRHGVHVAVSSDAHSTWRMDILGDVLAMLESIEYPQALVVNSSMERLMDELTIHGVELEAL